MLLWIKASTLFINVNLNGVQGEQYRRESFILYRCCLLWCPFNLKVGLNYGKCVFKGV